MRLSRRVLRVSAFLVVIGFAAFFQKQDARASSCLTVMFVANGVDLIECGPYPDWSTAGMSMYNIANSAAPVYPSPDQMMIMHGDYYQSRWLCISTC